MELFLIDTGKKKILVATIDHIIPRSKGGSHRKENLVDCCETCNGVKGSYDLKMFIVKLKHKIEINHGWNGLTVHLLKIVLKNANILLSNNCQNPNPDVSYRTKLKKRRGEYLKLCNYKTTPIFIKKQNPQHEAANKRLKELGIETADEFLKRREMDILIKK